MAFAKVDDFGVAETTDMPKLSLEMKPADAFRLAIKKEQAAMERGHKARLEKLFVDVAYPEVW